MANAAAVTVVRSTGERTVLCSATDRPGGVSTDRPGGRTETGRRGSAGGVAGVRARGTRSAAV